MARRHTRHWVVVLLLLLCSCGILWSVGDAALLWRVLRTLGVILSALVPLFYLVVVVLLLSAIPDKPALTPLLDAPIPDDMAGIDRQFLDAGFRRVGGLAQFNTKPKTKILNYIHEECRAYGTLQKLWRNPPAYGLISPREDGGGTLETLANPEVDALPPGAGTFRQVIPDGDMAGLVRHHKEAMALLGGEGLDFKAANEPDLESEMFLSNLRQRQAIWDRPFYSGWMVLWRTLTGSFPNLGPLTDRRPPAP